jgi:hypothetical protein
MTNMVRAAISIALSMVIGYLLGSFNVLFPTNGSSELRRLSLLYQEGTPTPYRITRTAILNTLAERYNYRSYLEIGQGDRRQNHDWIRCAIRVGVDPNPTCKAAYQMTSDEFFKLNNDMYDLIFIDGLHTAEQVNRDIINSLQVLRENGTIVVHDCDPTNKVMQTVPRKQTVWTGDVWKAWVRLRASRDDLLMYVVNADSGCGIIRRGKQQTIRLPETLDYEELDRNRRHWLNLVEVGSFLAAMRMDLPRKNGTVH